MAFASLPADVLRAIIADLPLRPRLLVVARVCRRWRAAAYASVTSITEPYAYGGPYERFPNLTACAFDARGVPGTWTAEQRARILSAEFRLLKEADALPPALPSLTSLSLLIKHEGRSFLAGATELMALNASSLVHLTLDIRRSAPYDRQLLPPLPALRSLIVHGCMGFVQHCCAAVVSQLTCLHAVTIGMSAHQKLTSAHLPAMRDLTLELQQPRDAIELATSLPSLTALHLHHMWSRSDPLPVLQAAHTKLATIEVSSFDPLADQAYRDALLLNHSLRHLIIASLSSEFVEAIRPLSSRVCSLALTEPLASKVAKNTAAFESLATHFTSITRLSLSPADNTSNLSQVRVWHRAPHLRELVSSSRPLSWVTAALQALPALESIRLREVTIGSNVNATDVKAFEAETRKADRRGMRLIRAESLSVSKGKYCVQYDVRPLQRSLRWLTLALGTADAP